MVTAQASLDAELDNYMAKAATTGGAETTEAAQVKQV